jgi:FixJ family two-component response regulator
MSNLHLGERAVKITKHNKTIFIIDDDTALLRSLERLLQTRGFCPLVFGSAQAFCASANPQDGLCLVLDINLNGSSGIEFRRQLAASGSSLPVIFITANDSESVRKDAIDAGCVAYLSKPFPARSLLDAIGKVAASPESRLAS